MGRLRIGDIEVAFEDTADASPNGPSPLLLLHGAVQSRRIWRTQIDALALGRRVIAPDLRGHGETTLGTARLDVERLALDALGLLDALGIRYASVCGLSLGGMVALEMAERAPSRLHALALANTPTSLTSTGWLRRLVDGLDPQDLLPLVIRLLGGERSARIGLTLASRIIGPHWVGAAARRHFIEGFRTMSPRAIHVTYRAIVEARAADVGHLACPTLLIAGRHDAPSILSQTADLAAELPDANLRTIPAGHVSLLDDPVRFNHLLAEFLEAHGA